MANRITTGMMTNNMLYDINNSKNWLDKWSRQMATNRKINRLSDDPVGLVIATQASSRIARIEHYQFNLDTAEARIKTAETSVYTLNNVVQRAYELIVQATTDINQTLERGAVAAEIRGLRDTILQTMNYKEGDKYIFGGFNTSTPPFTVDGDGAIHYNGVRMDADTNFVTSDDPDHLALAEQIPTIDISFGGENVAVSVTGYRLAGVGEDNLYTLMTEIIEDLEDPDQSAEDLVDAQFISRLQGRQNHLLTVISEFGGSYNRVKSMQDTMAVDSEIHTEQYSKIVDAEYGESVMRFKMAEAMYTATLQAAATIIQPTILDYLR